MFICKEILFFLKFLILLAFKLEAHWVEPVSLTFHSAFDAYCQHQGRIIALMWVQKQNDDFYLDFAPDLKTVVQNRLQMFHHFLPRITSFGKTHTHFLNIQIQILWNKFFTGC
jgi:hypothetical protein